MAARIRTELHSEREKCFCCGAALSEARTLKRSCRKLRTGEFCGYLGEFVALVCNCGRRIDLLWSVVEPRRRRSE